jgi:hypothetical protein
MSRPDEQLSTRDLASTPAEPRDETDPADDREEVETSARYNSPTEAAAPTPAAPAPDQYPGDRDVAEASTDRAESAAEPAAEPSTDRAESAAEPAAEPSTVGGEPARGDGDQARLLADDEGAELGRRWEAIQVTFVDDPRRAVEDADGLVAHVMQQLADGFARERETLEGQWSRGEDVSTEDLRVALQRYRSFFQRLLSA